MYLHALATAVPPTAYTQAECWEQFERSAARQRLSRRSSLILQAILRHDSGISKRHFALSNLEKVLSLTPDDLNEAFRIEAPRLAAEALKQALSQAELQAPEIDILLVCTCTGYLCPGVASYVAEKLNMRPDTFYQDFVGMGCGASIPCLRTAEAILARQPEATVACVAVEICSAAFFLDDDLGVLVSACLFGDGAAASIWRATPAKQSIRCGEFLTMHHPQSRDCIRFEMRDGKLRNLLHPSVPALAATAVQQLLQREQARPNSCAIRKILAHTGGRDVLDAIERACPDYDLSISRAVLRDYGNMSSPSVMFALDRALKMGAPDERGDWWLTSFGAGFSAHSCRIGI